MKKTTLAANLPPTRVPQSLRNRLDKEASRTGRKISDLTRAILQKEINRNFASVR